ncbi:MAG: glycosyltransferase [Roseomonas sp.]|nr:glycosyltransferase [Roseomonas sp.]MCA3328574.1 glycosyltransferase [Roseomonas sp.]MCA3331565.1 glycosyltransferase [Roseomonas sp.]MCA3336392.1 glycosyltransferase [Roseomonas sp.]MCA3346198.1 glycosyltransferase [Roseomonas sp.]
MPRDGGLIPVWLARPKILLLSAAHPPADIRVVLKEGACLAEAGYAVSHLCPAPISGSAPVLVAGVAITTFPARRGRLRRFLGIPRLAMRAAGQRAEVIHASEPDAWAAALLAGWWSGARVILDVHEHYPTRLDGSVPAWLLPVLRGLLHGACWAMGRAADAVVVAKDGLEAPFGGEARVVKVRNYALGDVAPRIHTAGPVTLLHLGALTRARGWPQMLEALALCPPETRLCLIGRFTDDSEAEFWARAEALGLTARIEAMGWLPHAAALAAASCCDIALILFQPGAENHRLALPHKLFDAMLVGLPVIAPAEAEEVAAVIEAAGCGALVDSADPEAIAEEVLRMANPMRRAVLGQAGREAALAHFSWPGEAARLVALYGRLTGFMPRPNAGTR